MGNCNQKFIVVIFIFEKKICTQILFQSNFKLAVFMIHTPLHTNKFLQADFKMPVAGNAYLKFSLFWPHHHLELISYLQNQRNLSEMKPPTTIFLQVDLRIIVAADAYLRYHYFGFAIILKISFICKGRKTCLKSEMKSISDVVV